MVSTTSPLPSFRRLDDSNSSQDNASPTELNGEWDPQLLAALSAQSESLQVMSAQPDALAPKSFAGSSAGASTILPDAPRTSMRDDQTHIPQDTSIPRPLPNMVGTQMPSNAHGEVPSPNIPDGEEAADKVGHIQDALAIPTPEQVAAEARRVQDAVAALTPILLPSTFLRASFRDVLQQIDISQARLKRLLHQQAQINHILQSVEAVLLCKDVSTT